MRRDIDLLEAEKGRRPAAGRTIHPCVCVQHDADDLWRKAQRPAMRYIGPDSHRVYTPPQGV